MLHEDNTKHQPIPNLHHKDRETGKTTSALAGSLKVKEVPTCKES
jgi:hypothetical protein